MAITSYPRSGSGSGGSGGGGLVLRDPPNIFQGANIAACRVARDAYFSAEANRAVLDEYQENQSLAIVLDPAGDNNSQFQTYTPGNAGSAYSAAQWLDRTDVVSIRGPRGESAELYTLVGWLATNAGVKTGETNYKSATGDFHVFWVGVGTHPKPGFTIPAGRVLTAIYWDGVDSTALFTASDREYTLTFDLEAAQSMAVFVRTAAGV